MHVTEKRSLAFAVLDWWGRAWGRVEAVANRALARFRRRRHKLEAEARLLGAEVAQLGAQLWSRVDDLPLVERFKLPQISTQFYGHGAFMGAAPALLADAKWRRILAFLMPDVFEQLRAAFNHGADAGRLIPMMENNPVMAAYGIWYGAQSSAADTDSPNHLTGLEWDVFVDGALLRAWEACKDDPRAEAEVMARVLDTTVIAHASSADTLQEAMGLDQWQDVRKTPKTQFGGVELDAWLDLFARALSLAQAPDLNEAVTVMNREPRMDADEEECSKHTFTTPWSVERAVQVHKEVTGKPSISVVLEIKSLRSTAEFLAALVRALNGHGVHVAAVASFIRAETVGVSQMTQVIGGREHPGPREIQFFHYAGDLQHACDVGLVEPDQSVMFNGASLLDAFVPDDAPADTAPVYSVKLGAVSELEHYRVKHALHIGLYVQESDCDQAAASLLSDLVAARARTFELGFAWGGLRDEVAVATGLQARLGYGSQRVLGALGKARQWKERP